MPWVIAGGGTSVTLTVVAGTPLARVLPVSWDDVGADEYHVFLAKTSDEISTYIGSTSFLAYDVPCLPETEYRVEVYSLDASGSVVMTSAASTLLPNVPFRLLGENMEYTTPAGAADTTQYTFYSNMRNDEAFPIVGAGMVIGSIADPPMPYASIGFKGASWVTDNAVPVPPSGGGIISGDTRPTPMVVFSDVKAIPGGVAPNNYMPFAVAYGTTGYNSVVQRSINWGSSSEGLKTHPSEEFYNDRRVLGNVVGADATGGTVIGPTLSHVIVEYGETNSVPASFFNVACFGDSTFAQQRYPTIDRTKEGIFYRANHALATAGRKLRFASMGEGGSKFPCIKHRFLRLAPIMAEYCQAAIYQLPTSNQPFTAAGQAEALWAEFLIDAAQIASDTGLAVHPCISTPPASFSQAQVNLDGYAYIAARIAEYGGINLAPILGGTSMSVAIAGDGAHLTQLGVDTAFPELVTQALALYTSIGADV